MAAPAILDRLSEADDLKAKTKVYYEVLGDISHVSVLFNRALVAIYIGGLFFPGTKIRRPYENIKEDVYQGTAGLVIKIGPTAFDKVSKVKVGDWVTFTPGDGKRIQIRGIDLRLIEDEMITMTIDDPEMITHRQ